MATDHLSKKNPDGTTLGQASTDLVGFYGATPVARPTAAVAAASTAATSTTPFGFTTSTQANALVTAVNTIITNLTTLGLHG